MWKKGGVSGSRLKLTNRRRSRNVFTFTLSAREVFGERLKEREKGKHRAPGEVE